MVGVAETLDVRIVSCGESQLPVGLRRQVGEIQQQAWPSDQELAETDAGAVLHDRALRPLALMLVEDDTVLASLFICSRRSPMPGAGTPRAG